MNKNQAIFVYRIIICITGWFSILVSMLLNLQVVQQGSDAITIFGNSFSYYTIQSNLLVAGWLTLAIIYHKKDEKPRFLSSPVQGAITLYITVTFLVFAVLLSGNYQPTGWFALTNFLLHYAIPIAFIVDWFITGIEAPYERKYALYWLTYPLGYLRYTLIRGFFTAFYPYYFIDLNVLSYLQLFINVCALTGLFLLLGSLYIVVNRFITKKRTNNST